MQVAFSAGEFGRLVCSLTHGGREAAITAADLPGAVADFRAAFDDALRDGVGECYWREGGGEYRWVFRKDGGNIRVAVLWSNGTLTGWEQKVWLERPAEEVEGAIRQGLRGLAAAAEPAPFD